MTNSKRFKTYQKGNDLIIVLYNPFSGWGKFTLAAYFLSVLAGSWLLIDLVLIDMFKRNDFVLIIVLIVAAVFVLYFLILRTIFRNANDYEILILNGENLQIQRGLGWFKSVLIFQLKEIRELKHLEEQQKADHPLKTGSFDYLGFQTEQKVIDEFYKDDRITFSYQGKNYSFGKDIMSYEFDDLLNIIQTKVDIDLGLIRIN